MARGPKLVLGVSDWTPDYLEPGHLPWAEIETKIGRSIPDVVRVEIFDLRQLYFEALLMYRQAPPQAEVDMLQNRIRNLCKELHRIAAATQKLLGSEAEDEVVQGILGKTATGDGLRRAFDGLAWQYGNDLREKFDAVASACCEIEAILREPDGFAPVTPSSPPDVLAFNDLYEKLADSATRWGFKPTENSPNFIWLVMWMIGWSDFKQAKNKIMNTRANHKRRIAGE